MYQNGGDLFKAVQAATQQFHGAYAIAVIANDMPQNMVVARMGCPLLIGLGEHETFIASDVSAVVAFTRQIMYLEDGDIAQLTADGVAQMIDKQDNPATRKATTSQVSLASLELGAYSHFMQKKSTSSQSSVRYCRNLLDAGFIAENFGENAEAVFNDIDSIKILACGTSYYAASTAKYWLESIAKIATDVEIASEYRYREVIANQNNWLSPFRNQVKR